MNDEQKKESRVPDKIDERKDKWEKLYEKTSSVGGIIGIVAAYLCTRIGIIPLSGWRSALFVGGGGAAGALVGMGFYYICYRLNQALSISTENNKNIEAEKDKTEQKQQVNRDGPAAMAKSENLVDRA